MDATTRHETISFEKEWTEAEVFIIHLLLLSIKK